MTGTIDTMDKGKALFDAAYHGDAGAVDALLIAGAPLDARDRRGNTPLIVAAANGHQDVAELLIDWGANVNAADLTGLTPLMGAAIGGHTDTARLLLEHDARAKRVHRGRHDRAHVREHVPSQGRLRHADRGRRACRCARPGRHLGG